MRRRALRRLEAFTLVEVTVSVALLSMSAMLAAGLLQQQARQQGVLTRRAAAVQGAATLLEEMRLAAGRGAGALLGFRAERLPPWVRPDLGCLPGAVVQSRAAPVEPGLYRVSVRIGWQEGRRPGRTWYQLDSLLRAVKP